MIRNKTLLSCVLLAIATLFSVSAYAEQETDDVDLGGGFVESAPWLEGEVIIPPYPQDDDLIKVEIDRIDMPFDFFLDSKNISYAEKEGLIRYTVVIRSNSGANNVLFEGIRCEKREYRTYAYGTYEKSFVKARTSEWKYIGESDFMAHRYNFFQHYMCNDRQFPNTVSEIIRKVNYPENFLDLGDTSD